MRFDQATIKQHSAIMRQMYKFYGKQQDTERIQVLTSLLTDVGYSPEDPKDIWDLTRGEASAIISKLSELISLEQEKQGEPTL